MRPQAHHAGGRRGKERAASLRAEQRLAAGGAQRSPDPKGRWHENHKEVSGVGEEQTPQTWLVDAARERHHLVAWLKDGRAVGEKGVATADHDGDGALGRELD